MKRAPRFAISSAAVEGAVATIAGAELHHMRDVMRLLPGTEVALFDERGAEYAGVIRDFQARQAVIEISAAARAQAEITSELILAAAVIKGPRMDFLVEKAAELGAAELWPVLCARGVAREVGGERLARWRRLASAAAKQSLAPRATEVIAPLKLEDLIRRLDGGRLCVVLSAGAPALGAVLRQARYTRAIASMRAGGRFHGRRTGGSARGRLHRRGTGRAAAPQRDRGARRAQHRGRNARRIGSMITFEDFVRRSSCHNSGEP